MASDLTPEQIQQLRAFQSGIGTGRSARRAVRAANNSQISELIEAARIIGAGRASGLTDDETITALARELVREDDRRLAKDPEMRSARQKLAEADLAKKGFAMDERDLKGSGQILREDNENMGYADYAEYEAAQREGKAALQLDENLERAREVYKLRQSQVQAQPKNKFRLKQLERASQRLEQAESAARDYAFGMNVYAAEGEDTRPGALQDQMLAERQRVRVIDGKRGVMQGGAFYEDPSDAAVPIPGGLRPSRGAVFSPEARALEQRRQRLREFVEGMGAKAQEERYFRGDLTEREMSERARLEAGQREFDTNQRGDGSVQIAMEPKTDVFPIGEQMVSRTREVPRGVGKTPGGKITLATTPSSLSTDDVRQGILAQLKARKKRSRSGIQDKIRLQNITNAGEEITSLLGSGGFPSSVRGGNIINLGSVKDKRADMGVQLGDQRVSFPEAIRVERPDGSVEYYDQNKALLGDVSLNGKPLPGQPLATAAEGLNAPIMGETAEAFVDRNIYDNYGAQNFGTDAILPNLAERGGGGGIPQVSIQGELGALEDAVARRLGIQKKGIRSVASLQAAADAVIADAQQRGRVLFTMQDGKKVFSQNPGLAEVMWDLKIAPAQQQAIANSLYQLEMARSTGVNLDAKERFFSGGRGMRTGWDGKAVITDVNDPLRGGDRLEIQKVTPAFGAQLRAADISPDAAKPFVGQLAGDPRAIQDNRQVYRGFSPVQVREQGERVARINAAKKRRAGKEPASDLSVVRKIRAMQEGNVMAGLRAAQAAANAGAEARNDMGRIVPGRPVPAALKGNMVELPGQARTPDPNAKLAPGPVRPREFVNVQPVTRPQPGASKPGPGQLTKEEAAKRKYARRKRRPVGINENPTVVEGAGAGIELPKGYAPKAPNSDSKQYDRQAGPTMRTGERNAQQRVDQASNILTKLGMDPRTKRGRRIGYGVGGGAAALATVLGLSNMDKEEERYY